MTNALVTGTAGFIGSHLAEKLIEVGYTVRGVDAFTDYYAADTKRTNLSSLVDSPEFEFFNEDLRTADLALLLENIDVVFHLAAQPGVRSSWTDGFQGYVDHNIVATQRLLEAAHRRGIERFVFASSSSVYGNAQRFPVPEDARPDSHSPYGVTKLAAEQLCSAYAANWELSAVTLRYFTVYGPRQRPDMAFHRLIESGLGRCRFPLYGTGEQIRDFTYVSDVVAATVKAAEAAVPAGTIINVSGGSSASMEEVIKLVDELTPEELQIDREGHQPGDVFRTGAAIERARKLLDWKPSVSLKEGIARQIDWHVGRGSSIGTTQVKKRQISWRLRDDVE